MANPTSQSTFKRFFRRIRIFKNIAFSGDYARDVNPADYEEHVGLFNRELLAHDVAAVVKEYIPITKSNKPPHILDIAAGTGIVSRALKKIGFAVTSTDLSPASLSFLVKKDPDITTFVADMNQPLRLPDGKYDGVTIVWGNRYISSTPPFLREVYRLLRDRGIFVWPIFPGETILWKLRNGFNQHTGLSALAKEATVVGFTVVEKRSAPLFRPHKPKGPPLDQLPGYLILRK